MISLSFVGDGPLDEAAAPVLVSGILGTPVTSDFRPWKGIRLHSGRGYERKLRFLVQEARHSEVHGVVATVDCDTEDKRVRLKELQAAREESRRTAPPFPTAIGEARPHLEAWLLDDPLAVRTGLRLPSDTDIPNVRHIDSPKEALIDLLSHSDRSTERPSIVWPDIAKNVELARCPHAAETGFAAFVRDVEAELKPSSTARN